MSIPENKNFLESSGVYLSPTRVETYERCPRQYWYRYEPDSPSVPRTPTAALSFNRSLRAALRGIYQQGGPDRLPQAMLPGLLEAVWQGIGFTDREEERSSKRQAVEVLERFLETNRSKPNRTLYLESVLTTCLEGVNLLVRPDRVDFLGPGLLVVDYTTGLAPKVSEHQVLISFLVLWKLHPSPADRPIQFSLYWLEKGQERRIEPSEETALARLTDYAGLERRIQEREFLATPSPQACFPCEANAICIYAQKRNVRQD